MWLQIGFSYRKKLTWLIEWKLYTIMRNKTLSVTKWRRLNEWKWTIRQLRVIERLHGMCKMVIRRIDKSGLQKINCETNSQLSSNNSSQCLNSIAILVWGFLRVIITTTQTAKISNVLLQCLVFIVLCFYK